MSHSLFLLINQFHPSQSYPMEESRSPTYPDVNDMGPKCRWRVAASSLILCLLTGMYLMSSRQQTLTGDGIIVDSGFWSYPRYTISFPLVEVSPNAEYLFHTNGLPNTPLTLRFAVVQPMDQHSFESFRLSQEWRLGVRIRDGFNRECYHVQSPLSDWQVQKSANSLGLWHLSLRGMTFEGRQEYTIEITILGPQESLRLHLKPQLTGGGNELP